MECFLFVGLCRSGVDVLPCKNVSVSVIVSVNKICLSWMCMQVDPLRLLKRVQRLQKEIPVVQEECQKIVSVFCFSNESRHLPF